MPVEETGNMLILLAARGEGSTATADFAAPYWPVQLKRWADLSRSKRGSTPRTSSAPTTSPVTWRTTSTCRLKAILALGGLTRCSWPRYRGREGRGRLGTRPWAKSLASRWSTMAATEGDHYPPGLRHPRHLEPEVQPRLGPPARRRPLPARSRAQGGRFLPDASERVRPAARQPEQVHQARLDRLDRHAGRVAQGLRGDRRPDPQVRR